MGVIILVILLVVFAVILFLKNQSVLPKNYRENIKTYGKIEEKYIKNGSFEVSSQEDNVLHSFEKYLIFYPSEIENSNKKYPVIVIANGTGVKLSRFSDIAKHYASWGFVVIGTEETSSWSGFGAEMSIRHLQRLNDNQKVADKESKFYKKIDFENVGIVGHSQGGVAVINAITDQKNKAVYKTAVSLSPTNKQLAYNLEWEYDAKLVNVPIMLVSGAGGGDDWVVTGDQLKEIYDDIPMNKLMYRIKDTNHGDVLYSADGYVTAWFMWQLQNDEEAKKAFSGENPEIFSNQKYQDLNINMKED